MLQDSGSTSANSLASTGIRGLWILAQQDLTAREREVWALVASGCTDAEIAERLTVNSLTARVHVSNLLVKLGVSNRQEAAIQGRQRGLAGDVVGH